MRLSEYTEKIVKRGSSDVYYLKSNNGDIKISLIIPVYMEEKILEDILQVYTKEICKKYSVEIIVSDGASTDKTCEIAKKYADILAVHNQERRQTIAEGRNSGGFLGSGDVLVFLNGDTYPEEPEKFFKFIYNWAENQTKYSKYSALACRVYVPKEYEILSDMIFYRVFNRYVKLLNLIGIGMGRGECQIVKREVFHKVIGYNPGLTAGEDFDLYKRISKIGKIGYTAEITVLESPRRFRKYGYLKVLLEWTKNALSVMIKGRASSSEWEAVR